MRNRAALRQLAGLVGVDVRYTDALGETREVPDDTLLALIGAFGLPSDPVHAQTQLEEQQNEMPLELAPALSSGPAGLKMGMSVPAELQ